MTAHAPCSVAILAGGMGTRLKSRTGPLPKPMVQLAGKPVLEHLVERCVQYGFNEIALLVHHEHEMISAYFGDGARWGARLSYCIEADARGTAGALHDALPVLDVQFLVLYGDTYAEVDLRRIWDWHLNRQCDATLFVHPNDHPADSDLVEIGADDRVTALHAYPHPPEPPLRNLVNAGLYVFSKSAIALVLPLSGKSDIAKHSIPRLLDAGSNVCAYFSQEYIKDMGTPDRLDKVERDIASGLTIALSTSVLRRAVFLDRDGTINIEVGHLKHPGDMVLIDGAAEAIKRLNHAGYLSVVVTNQPVLARGDVTNEGLDRIHARLEQLIGEKGGYLDRIYFCPHHPDGGFAGEVPALKGKCDCRKPAAGMLDRAVGELTIDRAQSWMIGDTGVDIIAGHLAGVRTIMVGTKAIGPDHPPHQQPHYRFDDIATAIDWILSKR